jgi:hypothetical protein
VFPFDSQNQVGNDGRDLMSDAPDRDVAIFTEALQLAVGERAAYLERACGKDGELRQRIEALLAGHDEVRGFFRGLHTKGFNAGQTWRFSWREVW